jgi:NTE family protein
MTGAANEALILSGGGGNAAYEVGVLKALAAGASPVTGYVPLEPAILSGSSAGAFNASVIASWPEASLLSIVEHLEDLWLNYVADQPGSCGNGIYRIRGNPRPYVDSRCWQNHPGDRTALLEDLEFISNETLERIDYLSGRGLSFGSQVLQFVDVGTFIDPERYLRLLHHALRADAIRRSHRVLSIAVTNWTTGEVHFFGNADMTNENAAFIVAASSALPGFFSPVVVGGQYYVDGGVVMDTPLKPAIRGGADVLHVIYQDPSPDTIPFEAMRSLAGAFDRLYAILKARVLNQDIELALRINEGLDVLSHDGSGGTVYPSRGQITAAAQFGRIRKRGEPYRKLTIHRYYPKGDVGGVAGILNFQADRLANLMEMGFQDAVHHDCHEAECVLADGS